MSDQRMKRERRLNSSVKSPCCSFCQTKKPSSMFKYQRRELSWPCKDFRCRKLDALEEGRVTDWKFLVGKSDEEAVTMHAFSTDLVLASEVFEAMEDSGSFVEGNKVVVRITDADPEIFQYLLMMVHVHVLPSKLELSEIVDLGVLASKYMVHPLVSRCATAIKRQVKVSNVWTILNKLNGCTSLANCCDEVLSTFTKKCLESRTFNEVTKESLLHFLKLETLNIPESFLVASCLRLNEKKARKSPMHPDQWIRTALPHLRLLNLKKEELEPVMRFLTNEEQLLLTRRMLFEHDQNPLLDTLCSEKQLRKGQQTQMQVHSLSSSEDDP